MRDFQKIPVQDRLPPVTDYFDGNSSKRVIVFTVNFQGEESLNVGLYSYTDKKWYTLASGTREVTHWLDGTDNYKV